MAQKKDYVDGLYIKEKAGQYGSFLSVGVKVDKLRSWLESQRPNQSGYINIVITQKREPGQHGDTHTAYLDTYVPKGKPAAERANDEEDVPF